MGSQRTHEENSQLGIAKPSLGHRTSLVSTAWSPTLILFWLRVWVGVMESNEQNFSIFGILVVMDG